MASDQRDGPEETVDGVPVGELFDAARVAEGAEPADPPEATEPVDEPSEAVSGPPGGADGPSEDFRPPGAELVATDHPDVFRALDRHDEEQILDELQGKLSKVMIYSFPGEGGGTIVDLSYQGVNEAVRRLANAGQSVRIDRDAFGGKGFHEEHVMVDDQMHVAITVYAVNGSTGYGQFGRAVQPLRMKLKAATAAKRKRAGKTVAEDNTVADEFAWTKALNKAQRNALKVQIPEEIRQVLIAQFQGNDEAVLRIKMGAAAEIKQLEQVSGDDAEAERERARLAFQRVQAVSRTKFMVPGKFFALLTQAGQSLELLREFADGIESLAAKAEKEGSDGGS